MKNCDTGVGAAPLAAIKITGSFIAARGAAPANVQRPVPDTVYRGLYRARADNPQILPAASRRGRLFNDLFTDKEAR